MTNRLSTSCAGFNSAGWFFRLLPLLVLLALTGCASPDLFGPVNLQEPGWRLQRGQAVWKPDSKAPEIAGEMLLAQHSSGRALLQFTKTPFPLVTAQVAPSAWQIEFPTRSKRFSGNVPPPDRFGWLHLLNAFNGVAPQPPWTFQSQEEDYNWRMENQKTGESMEGFLNP